MKLVAVEDPVNFVICADAGATTDNFGVGTLAYPDICVLECSGGCSWVDWEYCAAWAADCGLYEQAPNDGSFLTNPELRKPYARHLGGINIGCLDGHASWIHSDRLVQKIPDDEVRGVEFWSAQPDTVDLFPCIDWFAFL